jgi:hypothetical protein
MTLWFSSQARQAAGSNPARDKYISFIFFLTHLFHSRDLSLISRFALFPFHQGLKNDKRSFAIFASNEYETNSKRSQGSNFHANLIIRYERQQHEKDVLAVRAGIGKA